MARNELKSPKRRTLTKRLVREALLELLQTKDIKDVSVSELCARADINRTTFYNHYAGTHEVLAEIEDGFMGQLLDAGAGPRGEDGLEKYIEAICAKLQQNREVALLLLANGADPRFPARFLEAQGCEAILRDAGGLHPRTRAEADLLARYLCAGACSLVCSWLEAGCVQTPRQVAEILASVIQNGIGARSAPTGGGCS